MKVYFDNSATTKPFTEVIDSLKEVALSYYGNPSSIHRLGIEAEQLLLRANQVVAQYLGIDPAEVVFTSGGTEGNNLAIKGVAFSYQHRGKHIITTEIEHASVYQTCQSLEKDFGFEVTYLPVNREGLISLEELQQAIRDDTILVSIMHVNNEMGSVQPIAQIGQLLSLFPKLLFHVDDVQGFGKVPLNLSQQQIDLCTLSGHKFHGPKGTGILYVRQGIKLYPLFHGGAQQSALRPGTENIPAYVALAKACRLIKEQEEKHIQHTRSLRRTLIEKIKDIPDIQINSPLSEDNSAPHILNLSFRGLKPEVLVHALEEKGIYVSTKSACSSKSRQPSRILTALGLAEKEADSAIRISFSIHNTLEEVNYFIAVLQELLPYYYKIMKV